MVRVSEDNMGTTFEPGIINWSDFQTILDTVIKSNYESVISELVDNSIDAGASKIWIDYYGSTWEDFATIVFDDGKGFENENKLKNSFNLAGIDEEGNRIGKYNIGMKLTPLSRCRSVSVICKLDDGMIYHRGLNSAVNNENKNYGTFTEKPNHKAIKYAERILKSENNSWKTAVILFDWKKKPDINNLTSADKKDFAKKQKAYFGLVYYYQLLREDYTLLIDSENKAGAVKPIDPFWSDFTPAKIDERLNLNSDDSRAFKNDDKFLMKCFREWGTISTPRIPIPITVEKDGSKEEHLIYVTGYVIPATTLIQKIPSRYKKNVPVPYGHSPSYEEMGGLWFFRNGKAGLRCICFGPTKIGKDSKEGWYTLHNSPESWLNKTRIKIEFSPQLDEYLDMSSTKDCVDPSEDFLDQVIDSLCVPISDSRLRADLGNNKQFFHKNASKTSLDYVFVKAQTATSAEKHIIKDCPYCANMGPSAKMNPWHHKDTVCPVKPCEICGRECKLGECEYECSQCEENHKEEFCELNCDYCEYPEGAEGHGEEMCPKLCIGCEKLSTSCECNCPDGCGNSVTDCTCQDDDDDDDDDADDDSPKSFINTDTPDFVLLRLVKGDHKNNQLINEALEHISEN